MSDSSSARNLQERCIEISARNDFKLGGEYDRRGKREVRGWDKASQEHVIESGLT